MSKQVKIGNLIIGGGVKPAVQSMTTVRPLDIDGTVDAVIEIINSKVKS